MIKQIDIMLPFGKINIFCNEENFPENWPVKSGNYNTFFSNNVYDVFFIRKNFLDDTRYAQMLLKSYARKGYGTRRIKQELKKRGISNDDAAEIYSEYETDYSVLHSLLDKKLKGDVSDKKEIQKAIAFLQRRGFSWSEIKKALDEYINEHIEY